MADMEVEDAATAPEPKPEASSAEQTAAAKESTGTAPMEVDTPAPQQDEPSPSQKTEGGETKKEADGTSKDAAPQQNEPSPSQKTEGDETKKEADGTSEDEDADADEEAERKKKAQWAIVTAGLGYRQSKKRVLHAFENRMWPILEEGGWTTITCAREREEGRDDSVEATYYMPPGVKLAGGWCRTKEYTSIIKNVIDRILERRNELESRAADAYLDEVGDIVVKSQKQRQPVERASSRRSRLSSTRESGGSRGDGGGDDDVDEKEDESSKMTDDEIHHVSLSWKYSERMHFPKLTSRVGDNYQASSLPPVGTGSDSKDNRDAHCYDQVFDPAKASEAGVLDCVQNATNIPASLKEAAMVVLHQRGYKPDGLDEKECLLVAKPLDGSDWTDEDKALFREAIFEHRKDLKAVAKKMNKSMGNVMTYYLGSYKHSDDYRLLKLVCQQEKEKADDEVPDNDICRLCREGGHLLVCDSCDLAYHTECLKPAIETVPEGEWNCDYCLDEKLMAARDAILNQSNLLRKEQEGEVNDSKVPEAAAKTSSQGGEKEQKASKSAAQQQIYPDDLLDAAREFAAAFFSAAAATSTSQPVS